MPAPWNALLTASLVVLLGVGPSPGRQEQIPDTPEPTLEPAPAVSYSPSQRDAIDWAHRRFELAGLELPATEITFYPTTESCEYAEGLYEQVDGRHILSICVPEGDTAARTLLRRRTVAHELAHAWEHETLDAGDREHLMTLLETDVWYSADAAWKDRGGERLAETIVWGLYDQRRRPVRIDQPCNELHRDFIAITGRLALGPFDNHCSLDHQPESRYPS